MEIVFSFDCLLLVFFFIVVWFGFLVLFCLPRRLRNNSGGLNDLYSSTLGSWCFDVIPIWTSSCSHPLSISWGCYIFPVPIVNLGVQLLKVGWYTMDFFGGGVSRTDVKFPWVLICSFHGI